MTKEEREFLLERFYRIEAPKIMKSLGDDISSYVVPLFKESANGDLKIWGNSVFLHYCGKYLLISAKHVLENCYSGFHFLIRSDFVHNSNFVIYNHPTYDIGFLLLSDELTWLLDQAFIPFEGEIFESWDQWNENSFKKFGLHGYPEYLFINNDISHISMILEISKTEIYRRKNVDFEIYKLFELSKGKNLGGENVAYKELYGLSGTGMWMFEFFYKNSLIERMIPQLFGIVIEYGKSSQYSLKTIDISYAFQIPKFTQLK